MTPQLSFWSDDDHDTPAYIEPQSTNEPAPMPDPHIAPLPLRIADEYGFSLQHHIVEGVGYYSVTDWLAGVSGNADNRQATNQWSQIKSRFKKAGDDVYTRCVQLPYRTSNNKTYQRDFATEMGLYKITQRMAADTGLRNKILDLMAAALKQTDDDYRNPAAAAARNQSVVDNRTYAKLRADGFTDAEAEEWMSVRRKQIPSTNKLRDTWKARGAQGKDYASLTNRVTEVATGRTATQHKQALQVNNAREGLSAGENALIHVVSSLSDILHNTRDSRGLEELSADIGDTEGMFNRDEVNRQFSKRRPRLMDGGAS